MLETEPEVFGFWQVYGEGFLSCQSFLDVFTEKMSAPLFIWPYKSFKPLQYIIRVHVMSNQTWFY